MIKFAASLIIILSSLSLGQPKITYDISAEFFPSDAAMYTYPVSPESFMRAECNIKINSSGSRSIAFYLHGELRVDSIKSAGEFINYESEKVIYNYDYSCLADRTILHIPDNASEITIFYSGFFNPSKAGSISNYMRINSNEGVFLRGYGYSLWFPVIEIDGELIDEAEFPLIKVKLPDKYRAVITGGLLSEKVTNNTYEAVWQPGKNNIRNVQLTARKYSVIQENNVSVYFISDSASAKEILIFTGGMNRIFAKNLKKIKSEAPLYIMEMPEYGNISSGNVIGLDEKLFKSFTDDNYAKLTVTHELVHPYTHIPVEETNPIYSLIIEGFLSFFQVYGLYKYTDGKYDLQKKMEAVEKAYLEKKRTGKSRRGIKLPPEKPILIIRPDEIGNYKDNFILNDRVWLFIYDVWNQIGDDKFDSFLKELFNRNTINYTKLNSLINRYAPGYGPRLNIWLNSIEYPESFALIK